MGKSQPITVAELAEALCNAMKNGINPDTPVKITLYEPSVGARAYTYAISAQLGFDWETGDFRIEPEQALVRKEKP